MTGELHSAGILPAFVRPKAGNLLPFLGREVHGLAAPADRDELGQIEQMNALLVGELNNMLQILHIVPVRRKTDMRLQPRLPAGMHSCGCPFEQSRQTAHLIMDRSQSVKTDLDAVQTEPLQLMRPFLLNPPAIGTESDLHVSFHRMGNQFVNVGPEQSLATR
ncbi:hypothetical protein D3C76_1321930 [compost metagenome]